LRHAPLFRFLMHRMLPAPFAKFLELDFALHFLFIFARPIVDALAHTALEFDEIWLGHVPMIEYYLYD
jgi:hypothetical protein